jgi:MipA family protein
MTISLPSAHALNRAAAIAAGLALAVPAAHAQSFDAVRLFRGTPGQDGGLVGLAVIAGTEYRGSDERRTQVLPTFDYQWTNGWFAGLTNGVGYDFSKGPDMQYGARLTFDLGRDESRSDVLRGMGDIDWKPEAGVFFNYFPSPQWFLTSSLRYGAGNHGRGVVVDFGAGHASPLATQWLLVVGMAVTLTNAEYMQSFFGVTPEQAASSGHPVYTPGAGARDLRANFALTYYVSRQLSFTGALSVSTLLGDAKDSPLTRDVTSPTGVFALSYSF